MQESAAFRFLQDGKGSGLGRAVGGSAGFGCVLGCRAGQKEQNGKTRVESGFRPKNSLRAYRNASVCTRLRPHGGRADAAKRASARPPWGNDGRFGKRSRRFQTNSDGFAAGVYG